MIKVINRSDIGAILAKRKGTYGDIQEPVKKIIDDVRKHGDRALLKFRKLYDHIGSKDLTVDQKVIKSAFNKLSRTEKRAFMFAIKRVTAFHIQEKRRIKPWRLAESTGISYGEFFSPVQRVGLYVPGGSASYPSTVIMNAVPALVAGVKDITMATPSPDYPVLAVAGMLGIKRVVSMGGAHAIAALAYGTESIEKVDKIVGPGNRYVTLAKKLVYGDVGIDMVAGPSEVVIVADGSVNPSFIAADLMAQAEHDEQAMSVLIAPTPIYIQRVNEHMRRLVSSMKRKATINKSLRNYGFAVVANTLKRAMDVANLIAPEHLELAVRKPQEYLKFVRNAGAVFLGAYTPEVLGDYVAGPDHVLPTMGSARFSSGLGVYDFMKRTTLLEVKENGFLRLAPYAEIIGRAEGLDAHIMAARIRIHR